MVYQPVERLLDSSYTIQDYLRDELRAIAREMSDMTALELRTTGAPPVRPRDGMIVSADGVGWNPGSGAGIYGYVNGAWVPLSPVVTAGVSAKAGNFTRDTSLASGTQSVTGVGFQPKAVFFLAAPPIGSKWMASVGFTDGTDHSAWAIDLTGTITGGLGLLSSVLAGPGSGDYQAIQGIAMQPDGFAVSWVKTGTPTGTITVAYLALR